MKKTLNELSLLPNLGIGAVQGTTGTTGTATNTSGGLNAPGSKSQTIAKSTALLTKQINDIANKIAATKQKAAQSSQGDQQKLVQTISLLQKQLQNLTSSENEESNLKKKIAKGYKTAANITGQVVGSRTGIPGAGAVLGKMGEYTAGKMSKFLGLENKKSKSTSINNIRDMRVSNKTTVKEGLLPAIGKAVKGVTSTAGNVAGMVPVVGGPVKAAADLAGDVATGILGGNEDEERDYRKITPAQEISVNKLQKNGFRIGKISYSDSEYAGGPEVIMNRKKGGTMNIATVEPSGTINGESPEDYFANDENEEKLSPKQKAIAHAAPPFNKITGADFKALRKESIETKNFLKAVLQKNYSEANKYLGSLVNEKIKHIINKAIDKTK